MTRTTFVTFVTSLLTCVATIAAQTRVTVEAGDCERVNSPIAARIKNEKLSAGPVALVDEAGTTVQGQVNLEADGVAVLRWIEPRLDAGKSRSYTIQPAKAEGPAFRFKDGNGVRDLLFGDTPVWRDMLQYDPADHANTFKPYQHVYAAGGGEADFITKGPGGKYTHHRGIFFGFKASDGDTLLGDFWHCPDVSQRHAGYVAAAEFVGPTAARCAEVTNWIGKDGKTAVVRDTRTETTWRVSPDTLVLDYDIAVESLIDKPLKLWADAHHAGFHFRAAQEVADAAGADGKPGAASYVRPPAAKDTGNDIWSDCAWTACSFQIKGKPYEVTLLDAPSNPRPTTFSTRPYGRFGAFFTANVKPGDPLRLRYRLIIRSAGDGALPASDAAARAALAFREFANSPVVSVKR